jgi:hypothetical protein
MIVDGSKYRLRNGMIVTMKANIYNNTYCFNAYKNGNFSLEAYTENGYHYHYAYKGLDIVEQIDDENYSFVETVENSLLKYIFFYEVLFLLRKIVKWV